MNMNKDSALLPGIDEKIDNSHLHYKMVILGALMLAASALTIALTPEKLPAPNQQMDLETMIPHQFGDWKLDESIIPIQASPDVQAKLDKIYNQTISRTYINNSGMRIMLSIAYGSDQSDSMAVHKPEVCYPAQGFNVLKTQQTRIVIGGKPIPAKQMVAQQGARIEPITYWINVGNTTVTGGLDRKIAQLKQNFTGQVPDGMLVRVSNISPNINNSFLAHQNYLEQLKMHINPKYKERIFGAESRQDKSDV
jgi:EpsI family protein